MVEFTEGYVIIQSVDRGRWDEYSSQAEPVSLEAHSLELRWTKGSSSHCARQLIVF